MQPGARPDQVPRWGGSSTMVQPAEGVAASGFATEDRPPAQWINWLFNRYGAWFDFLRGPNVEHWTRVSGGTEVITQTNRPFAIDTATIDVTGAAFRYAMVGEITGTADAVIRVSKTGAEWADRTNAPETRARVTAIAVSNAQWVLASQSGAIYYGAVDDGTGAGPVGANGNAWSASTQPATLFEVSAFARGESRLFALGLSSASTVGVYSDDDGVNWTACSVTGTARSGDAHSAVFDGVRWVFVTQTGQAYASPDGATFAYKSTFAATAVPWYLAVGVPGEVVAYRRTSGTTVGDFYKSTDGGATWSTITPSSARKPVQITSLRYASGQWIASSAITPFLWSSNDLLSWRALRPPVTGSASFAVDAVAWDGSAWCAVGRSFALQCLRAADPGGATYDGEDGGSTLADAAYLRGREVSDATPADGEVLTWSDSLAQWIPAAGGGGGSSPTTTRGDIIRRGASADQRLALGASGYVLTSDGTDPVWAAPAFPKRTIDPMTGTGWTSFSPGAGQSIVWGSSKLTLTTPSGVSAGDQCGAYKSILTSGESYDLAVRVKVTGANSDAGANLNVIVGKDTASNRLYFQMRFDGALQSGGFGGGVWVSLFGWTAGNTIGSSDRTGGELWFRIRRDRATIVLLTGVGTSGAVPTSWTQRHRTTSTDALDTMTAGGLFVTVSMDSAAPATDAIIEILDIRTVEEPVAL